MTQHFAAKTVNAGRSYQDIPKLAAWPLLGVAPMLRRDPLSFMLDAHRTHSDIVAMSLGLQPAVQITHPDFIRRVLIEALMEMQVVLASVASHYRLRLTSDHLVSAQALITTLPRTPIMMRLEQRRGAGL